MIYNRNNFISTIKAAKFLKKLSQSIPLSQALPQPLSPALPQPLSQTQKNYPSINLKGISTISEYSSPASCISSSSSS